MAPRSSAAISTSSIWTVIPYFLIAYLYFYILLVQRASLPSAGVPDTGLEPPNFLATSRSGGDPNTVNALQQRVKLLETKLNTYLSFGTDPFLNTKTPAVCRNSTKLLEYCPFTNKGCHLGMAICLDDFPAAPKQIATQQQKKKPRCVIYDFGIREQPDFGVILSQAPFDCEVHAFDPSPITKKWYASNQMKELRENNKNYQLHDYGGGGADETIYLREYNWNQVSVYTYPAMVLNPNNCTESGRCRYNKFTAQQKHSLPVRSVESVMKQLGHDHIDILKIDVEGSEYRMLEALIESGVCRKIDQITLEWHHYDFDLRYGAQSIPILNMLSKLLQEECGLYQHWIHDATGWPSNEKIYSDMGIIIRYNIAAFMRVKSPPQMETASAPK